MGIGKTIKKALGGAIKAPINALKSFFTKTLMKLLLKLVKVLKDKVGKPIMNVIKGIVKILVLIKKWLMNIVKKIVDFFKLVYFYIKCVIKMLTNFYKCAVFYILDCSKFTFLYLPIMIIAAVVGFGKEWMEIQEKLDSLLQWPNGIQNDCYRCKNKDPTPFNLSKYIQEMIHADGEAEGVPFSFYGFLCIISTLGALIYTFWHYYLRKTDQDLNP